MHVKLKLSYVCKREDCEVKMVLVERYGKDNEIKNIFYSKMDYSFECLKHHGCGKVYELKEVHPSKDENGVKLKQNKLFQECAVKRDNNIETLVKHVELSPTQILFFSKGEHVYHAGQAQIKQNCEKDKAAKMKIPVKHITLVLRGEKKNKIVWKDYEEFNSNKKSVVMVIKPFLGSKNKHCSAMAANHYYQIFLCRKVIIRENETFSGSRICFPAKINFKNIHTVFTRLIPRPRIPYYMFKFQNSNNSPPLNNSPCHGWVEKIVPQGN
ncbi:unnamed protein product [Meloidogyne enterolobii]|uniref:Uncharacterized protein n=1 Tax=Meloidogyne enterolobii TaxID=390850 RepID=A0ACB1AAK0_MELEN